ncbi:MAG: hypothetical protein ABJ327_26400 [Litoreibacter sp.]
MTRLTAPCLAFYATLLVTAALFAVLLYLPYEAAERINVEGGLVETLSAILSFVSFGILLGKGEIVAWPFAVMLLAFGLRELDLDKKPFTEGLLKSRQYIGDTVPMPERVISAVVLITILIAFVLTIKRGAKPLMRGLANQNGIAWCVGLALVLAVTAKTVDGLARKLEPFGIALSETLSKNLALYEETAELGMALALLFAVFAWFPKQTHDDI